MGSWLIKESIKKYLQHRRDYNNRKENKENYDDDDDDNNQLPAPKKRKEKKNSMNYIANFLQKKII
jgi:hypothetical protein